MLPTLTHTLILTTLRGIPDVLDGLLRSLGADDARWDARPNPDRFTLREIVAHLADMERVWLERLTRICQEDEPKLPNSDPDEACFDHDYAHSDPRAALAEFRTGRQRIIAFLETTPSETWERVGLLMLTMPITLELLMVHIAGHDGYHTQQIAQWIIHD